jgi:PhnB protein
MSAPSNPVFYIFGGSMPDHVRNGFSAVRPYVFGAHDILDFIECALNGQVLVRHKQDGNAEHVEVQIGDSIVVLELRDPPHEAGFPGSIYIYVEDVDLVAERAEDCAVEIFSAVEDKPYAERQMGIRDSYGNVWWVATYKAELDV